MNSLPQLILKMNAYTALDSFNSGDVFSEGGLEVS